MRKPLKINFGNILLGAGIALLLLFAVYKGATYPWRMLFSEIGLSELPTELPDPAPIAVRAIVEEKARASEVAASDETAAQEEPKLPDTPSPVFVRPKIELEQIGIIKIPKIGLAENIADGIGDELYYAVGHVGGTPLPGESGNCVLAGHRGYVFMQPFRYLDHVAEGDNVFVTYKNDIYKYVVFKSFIVAPDEVWVMSPQEEEPEMLTLVTCTPVLNPTHRLIVWCRLDSVQKADEQP